MWSGESLNLKQASRYIDPRANHQRQFHHSTVTAIDSPGHGQALVGSRVPLAENSDVEWGRAASLAQF
jgi:hypothetical protein